MAARAIRDDDADYSFLIKQCSSTINCCSVNVRFCATRWPQSEPLSGSRREGDHGRTKLESCRCLRTPASAHVGDRHHRHGRLRTCRRRRDGRGATDVHRRSGGADMPKLCARYERFDDNTCVWDRSPQTQRSPTLSGGGPLRDPAIDAGPWQQPGRTPRCPRPSAGHDRGAAVHPSSCRG